MGIDNGGKVKKRNGGFIGPGDMDVSKRIDDPPPETGGDVVDQPPGSEDNKKPKWLWIAIIGIVAIVLITASIIFLKSSPKDGDWNEPKTSFYQTNGFSVSKVQSRLLNRTFLSAFENGKQEYYDTVFNAEEDNHEYDLFAPIVDLQALNLSDFKKSELVIAIFFSQNSETNEPISKKTSLKGLSSAVIEKTGEYLSLPSAGIIYIGLDDLVEEVSAWSPGNYQLALFFEDDLVKEVSFTITK